MTEPRPSLDPESWTSVAVAVTQIEIDAPVEVVWNTLLDFPSYTTWNPFVRSQVIMDASWKSHLADQKPRVGSNIMMKVHNPPALAMTDPAQMRPSSSSTTKETITYLDEDAKIVVWDLVSYPQWFLRSKRLQSVVQVDSGNDGKKMTKYISIEALDGIGAWIIKWFILARLKVALDGVAKSLKDHTERQAT